MSLLTEYVDEYGSDGLNEEIVYQAYNGKRKKKSTSLLEEHIQAHGTEGLNTDYIRKALPTVALPEETSGEDKFDSEQYAKDAGRLFLNGVAGGLASAGATVENWVGKGLDKLFPGAGFEGSGLFNILYNGRPDWKWAGENGLVGIKQSTEHNMASVQENAGKIDSGLLRKAAEFGGDISYGLGNALPMAAEAMITGGASAAASVTKEGLLKKGAEVVERTGVLNTLNKVARDTLENKEYWTSFVSEVGLDYYDALDNGATDDEALRYAISSAGLNSIIEIGGGIQKIPEKPSFKTWLKSAHEEGMEEIEQGIVSRVLENAVYDKGNPFVSFTDDNAILNPSTALGEYAGGVTVGGILSGGQQLTQKAVNNSRFRRAYGKSARELVTEALDIDPDNAVAQRLQEKLDKKKRLTTSELRQVVEENEAVIADHDRTKIQSAAENRLTELGETDNVPQLAGIAAKKATGEVLTRAEQAQIDKSRYGRQIIDELNPENIRVGAVESEWVKDIGTAKVRAKTYNRETPKNGVTGAKYNPETQKLDAIVKDSEGNIQTVPLKEAKASPMQEELFDWAEDLKEAGPVMVGAYQATQDLELYARSFRLAYEYGKAHMPMDYVENSEAVNYLHPVQLQLAYGEGAKAQQRQTQAAEEKIASGGTQTVAGKKKPAVSLRGATVGGNTYAPVDRKTLNRRQWASVEAMRAFSKATGVDVVFYQSQANEMGEYEGANGFFRDGTIYLDINAGRNSVQDMQETAVLKTAAHELTHFIQRESPTQYEELKQFVVERLVWQEGVSFEDIVTDKQRREPELSYNEAVDEVVADACEMMLKDSTAVERLANENRSLARRIADWLRKWVRSIKTAMEGLKAERPESVAMMQYAEELQKLWDDALVTAAKNNRGGMVEENSGGTKFSLREPVEKTRDLLALHNMTLDNLREALKLGGLPMPSIAIVKASAGHSKYGPISVVFKKNTIDPQADRRNKVYGGDAYTPTAPQVEYPVQYKAMQRVEKHIAELSEQVAGGIFRNNTALRRLGIDSESDMDTEALADRLSRDDGVQAAYLADTGKTLEPVRKLKEFSRYGNGALQQLVSEIGVQELARINAEMEAGNYNAATDAEKAVRDIIRSAYEVKHRNFLDRKPELKQQRIDKYMENYVSRITVEDFVRDAWEFYQDNGATTDEIDRWATADKLHEVVDPAGVKKWLLSQLDGVLGEAGIYNGKERYTPSGNERSFAQTHYAYTLENIVRAMTQTQDERGGQTFGVTAKAMQAVSAPSYGSIAEVKNDSGRLGTVEGKAYEAAVEKVGKQIEQATRKVMRENKPHSDNEFDETQIIGEVMMEAAQGAKTEAAIRRVFQKEGYSVSREAVDMMQTVFREAAQLPTEYFEAKPRRAIRFDEAAAVVVPDNLPAELKWGLEKQGATVREYKAGDEQSRLAAVNEDETVRFSKREKYWRPKLSRDEWNLLNRRMNAEVQSGKKYVDESTKWVYADEKGVQVFALYGVGDGTEATPLYAVGGMRARMDAKEFIEHIKERERYDGNRENLDALLEGYGHSVRRERSDLFDLGGRQSKEKNAGLYGRQQGRDAGGASEGGAEDQRGIIKQNQQREPRMSDRDVLEWAAEMAQRQKNKSWTEEDRNRLNIFATRLKRLREAEAELAALKEEREVLLAGRKVSEVKGEERDELLKNKNRIDIAKNTIKRLESEVYEIESKAVIKTLLKKSRSIVERDAAFTARQRYREQRWTSQRKAVERRKVERVAKKLMTDLATNTDKKHIPEPLKRPIGELLESLDFLSGSKDKNRHSRGREREYGVALRRLKDALERQRAAEARDAEGTSGFVDLPEGLLDVMRAQADKFEAAAAEFNPKTDVISSMSLVDLNDLYVILSSVREGINKIDEMFSNQQFATVTAAGENSLRYLSEAGEGEAGRLKKALAWDNTLPWYAFQRFGEGGKAIFEGLMDGHDKFAFNANLILEFRKNLINDKKVREWDTKIHEVELENQNGKKVRATITTSQLMNLYCLSKRKHALNHLFGGGIRLVRTKDPTLVNKFIEKVEKHKEKKNQRKLSDHLKLTDVELGRLLSLLTPEQIRIADALQKFATEMGSMWGNEITMIRFGYRGFTEPIYWTIETDTQDQAAEIGDKKNGSIYRLQNISAVKPLTEGANNAVLIRGIFDVFSDHMTDMAKYNALVLPLLDAQRWLNYRNSSKNDAGQVNSRTVQRAMTKAYGEAANKYIVQFLQDLNGVKESGDRGDNFAKRLISKAKRVKVAFNFNVAIQQPTSYLRASAVIDYKYLAKAFSTDGRDSAWDEITLKRDRDELLKYSGIALWKDMGFFDTDIGRSFRERVKGGQKMTEKIADITMLGAEWGDKLTWARLWRACKLEVQDTQGLKGEELMKAAAHRFREVIYRTQVVDSTMTRSHNMRSNTTFAKYATAFMSEPTVSYNVAMHATEQIADDAKRLGSLRMSLLRNGNKAIRAYQAAITAGVLAALMNAIDAAFRDADDEPILEKIWNKFFGEKSDSKLENVANVVLGLDGTFWGEINPLSKIPELKGFINTLSGFGSTRMDLEACENAKKAVEIWDEYVRLEKGELDKATKITYYGNMTPYGRWYPTMKALSDLSGLPISNVSREIQTLYNSICTAFGVEEDKLRTYENKKLREAWDKYGKSSGISYATMFRAVEAMRDIEGDKDEDGNTISGSQKAKYVEYIRSLGLTSTQERAVWEAAKVTSWSDKGTPWG